MLQYDRIDAIAEKDVDKTNMSHRCTICNCYYFCRENLIQMMIYL